ncbi:large ribosomal subunit protein mL64-like [Euwallacea fornicatus]|uniref:large ribosomal subunit protein mL64-like n=1 Tax=Euwallacea fornicatus TaxID=995702 RepID=UPI0033901CD2
MLYILQELEDAKEYESVKYPYTIPQIVAETKVRREEKERMRHQRQEDIVKKMLKLEQWKQELHARIQKKESEAMEAKTRKDRLIEEVRRHFGYTVDPKDSRFKELLEKKEKEQKKAMKDARKKAREDEFLKKLLSKKAPSEQIQEDATGNTEKN